MGSSQNIHLEDGTTVTIAHGGRPTRIARTTLNLAIAKLISLRGTCMRGQNGAVITQNNRIVSTGYNGSIIKGWVCAEQCDIAHKCEHAVHAERNAIFAAAKFGISLEGSTMYVTSSPCYDCAQAIIQSGIKVVVYTDVYETDKGRGLALLNETVGIEVYQCNI